MKGVEKQAIASQLVKCRLKNYVVLTIEIASALTLITGRDNLKISAGQYPAITSLRCRPGSGSLQKSTGFCLSPE